mmetsp:Transcript_18487/g.35116  ORF Transcript_18487/g.35116 Transcript_18487/m.35116 type:complete len:742 (-) Transcript_18487:103-2328(-)|eukprot:scaffold701_cov158-Amphora_coffeaeformis.AAC.15
MMFLTRRRRGKRALKGVGSLFVFLALVVAVFAASSVSTGRQPASNLVSFSSRRLLEEEAVVVVAEEGGEGEAPHAKKHGEEGEEEEGWQDSISPTNMKVMTCIVLVLILLTVAFEVMKEHVEESVPEDFEVILEKFFGELTILGFLSMVTFIVSQAGIMTILSEKIYGEGEEEQNELLEYFEFVHFALFFIMVAFVMQVLGMISEAEEQHEIWAEIDEEIRHHQTPNQAATQEEIDEMAILQHKPWYSLICSRLFLGNEVVKAREEIVFKALRREFIVDREVEPPFETSNARKRVEYTFNYGRYLGLAQIHILSHVVEVEENTWLFFAAMTVVFYLIGHAVSRDIVVLGWVWVSWGWLVFLGNFVFVAHLSEVRNAFLPYYSPEPDEPNENTRLTNGGENGVAHRMHNEAHLPKWCTVDLEHYMAHRPLLARLLVGGKPNKQQSLMWMDRQGPKFYVFLLQVNLIFAGIYAGLLLLLFFPYNYEEHSLPYFLVYTILALVPLAGIFYNKRDLVAIMAEVTSIGTYRKDQIIRDVLLEESTMRIVRTFLIIHRMRRVAEKGMPEDEANIPTPQEIPKRGLKRSTFSQLELDEVGRSFDAFDIDKSGSISHEEFRELLQRLGADVQDLHFDLLVSKLDADGDGEVTKEEFCSWYQFYSKTDTISLEERAKDLFHMFDPTGSGEITLGQFKARIDALDMGFSMDEIGSILNELDRDRSGSVSLEEFEALLKKFYPNELRRKRGE